MVNCNITELARSLIKKQRTLLQIAHFLANIYYRFGGIKSYERKLIQELSSAAHNTCPIIIGPWTSEVGFEVLYWVPFIRYYLSVNNINPSRVTVLSRGGAGLWYQGCYRQYIEIFDLITAKEFKMGNDSHIQQTKMQKQMSISEFDRELIHKAGLTDDLEKGFWLHPRYMYQMFTRYWTGKHPPFLVDRFSVHEHRQKPELPKGINLIPGNFIAVKFYFSDSFPDNDNNRVSIANILNTLARAHKVVLMNTCLFIDDHSEYIYNSNNIIDLSESIILRENLDLQTRILANSKFFIGTYGGFSYIPPYYGVPSYAFYSDENGFSRKHLDVAIKAFQNINNSRNQTSSNSNSSRNYLPIYMPVNINKFDNIQNIIL